MAYSCALGGLLGGVSWLFVPCNGAFDGCHYRGDAQELTRM
jgi:hypothetical protein